MCCESSLVCLVKSARGCCIWMWRKSINTHAPPCCNFHLYSDKRVAFRKSARQRELSQTEKRVRRTFGSCVVVPRLIVIRHLLLYLRARKSSNRCLMTKIGRAHV